MRKKHLDILKKRVLSMDLPWLARQAGKYFGAPAGYFLGRALARPVFGGLVATYRCNEACPMCNVRSLAGKRDEIGTERMLALVGQFAELGVSGVSVTGGEPLMREDILLVVSHMKAKGLPVSMSTNGLLLAEGGLAGQLLATGIDSVAVSIDGATPARHDASRGRAGAFEKSLAGIENLLAARRDRKAGSRPALITMAAVLSPANIGEFEDILKLAVRLGVDNVSLNPVHETRPHAGRQAPGAPFDGVAGISAAMLDLKRRYPILDSSAGYLKLLDNFAAGNPLPMRCLAPYFSLYVDCYENILPCGGWFYESRFSGNLRGRSLDEVWFGEEHRKTRAALKDCRACHYSCMMELNVNHAPFI
jgi:MoaA/NifB/PqqE/SkfB family radical SAM enzyme